MTNRYESPTAVKTENGKTFLELHTSPDLRGGLFPPRAHEMWQWDIIHPKAWAVAIHDGCETEEEIEAALISMIRVLDRVKPEITVVEDRKVKLRPRSMEAV